MIYTLKSESMKFAFSDIGAELISATDNSAQEFIWTAEEEIWNEHSPVLFPLCGRILGGEYTYKGNTYKMGCHGFFSSSLTEVIFYNETKIVFRLKSNEQTLKVYPFDFEVDITYTAEANKLSVRADIKNSGNEILPFMYGAHPGFNLPLEQGLKFSDYKILFENNPITIYHQQNGPFVNPKGEKIEFKDGIMTLSSDAIRDAGTLIFSGTGNKAKLFSEHSEKNIEVSFDDQFKYLCFWKADHPKANYICIEPWTGVPSDGITPEDFETRASMERLNPGETSTFTYEITFNV